MPKPTFSTEASEGLRELAQTVAAVQPAALLCPECGADLQIQFSGRNGRWSARHPHTRHLYASAEPCRLALACWGSAESEQELREQFAAGAAPRVADPQTREIVQKQIERLCLINGRRHDDRSETRRYT